jgi:hypothetical protein
VLRSHNDRSADARPAPGISDGAVIADRPDRQHVELGEFVMELADLVLSPRRIRLNE